MKFDLRLYVLVLGVDPLRIFLFKDGLARLATSAYQKPNDQNMQNLQMHLTNYAINKNSNAFLKNYTAQADFTGSKRSLKFVIRYLKKTLKADTVTLMREIRDMIIKTLLSAQPHLSNMYKTHHCDDFENSLCFEILGFDIMLDQNFKPYLLEINHAPSFQADSPLDEKIKGQVIYDTLNLLGLSQKRKRTYKSIQKMKLDIRRFSSKKTLLPQVLKEHFRKDFDEIRNQYEFRNKGMFEMIYPILDEITLDPIEEDMRKYSQIQRFAYLEYCKKHNIKVQLSDPAKTDKHGKDGGLKRQGTTTSSIPGADDSPSKLHRPHLGSQKKGISKVQKFYKQTIKSRVFGDERPKKTAEELTVPLKLDALNDLAGNHPAQSELLESATEGHLLDGLQGALIDATPVKTQQYKVPAEPQPGRRKCMNSPYTDLT